jgi:ribosomal protein S27AE|tara:strand:+ start:741 stop:1784 length:1044 start_codon:yes stop_codon:yes gene_type:complete
MSLGCYIISKKKILINKEAVKDKTRHVSPEKLIINEDSIFIYGDEDENQLIKKILSVEGVHRYGVFSLIFVTLNVYYKNRVKNTLNKLKKVDINTYNEVKRLLYTDKKNTEITKIINNPLKNKFCTNCGTKIISKNRFCTNCGSEIFSSNSPIIKSKSELKNPKLDVKNKNDRKSSYVIISIILILGFIGVFSINKHLGVSQGESTTNKILEESQIFETVTLTNKSNISINVSLGFRDSDRDVFKKGSIGWYTVEPNDNKVIDLLLELKDEKYSRGGDLWLYARSIDGESIWAGDGDDYVNSEFWVDDYKSFYLKSYWKPREKGNLSIKTFFKIQLEAPNTNFSFTE